MHPGEGGQQRRQLAGAAAYVSDNSALPDGFVDEVHYSFGPAGPEMIVVLLLVREEGAVVPALADALAQ